MQLPELEQTLNSKESIHAPLFTATDIINEFANETVVVMGLYPADANDVEITPKVVLVLFWKLNCIPKTPYCEL